MRATGTNSHSPAQPTMRVSIVILSYNYEQFVEQTIRSALEQTHPDTEVVVVDDGSTDGSRAVIARWEQRVRTVFKPNGGQPSAYNAGFAAISGDIVIFLDCDDTLEPDACAEIVRAFAPGVVKAHYRLRLMDRAGRTPGPSVPSQLGSGDVRRTFLSRGRLYPSSPASGNAYLVSALRRIMPLPIDPQDPLGADFFAIHGIAVLGEVRVAGSRPLGAYRVHKENAAEAATFGNCAQAPEPEASYRRYRRLRAWLRERLGEDLELPEQVRDFSLEKLGFAATLGAPEPYLRRLQAGARLLWERLLPAIYERPGSLLVRAGLVGWSVAVLVLPPGLGKPLLRYVCNPLAR